MSALTFAAPFKLFQEMEASVKGILLEMLTGSCYRNVSKIPENYELSLPVGCQ